MFWDLADDIEVLISESILQEIFGGEEEFHI